MQLKVGADPEFFLVDRNKGVYVSAHDVVPGTKENPHRVKQGAVQVDGTSVEFNIDPASTEEEFVDNVLVVLSEIRNMIPMKYEFHFRPYVNYDPIYFKKLPRSAVDMGCIPDFSAYSFSENPRPDSSGTIRTGAGHVHVGWLEGDKLWDMNEHGMDHHYECGRIARNLDVTLGILSLTWDRDRIRRRLYGKAGAYRPKPYGIEYRTLSNMWLTHNDYIRQVYRGAIAGVTDYFENGASCMFMRERAGATQDRIDRGVA